MERNQRGFTLIELLVVIGIIGLISALAAPIFNNTRSRNDFGLTVSTTKQVVRQAHILARSQYRDGSWGVRIDNGKITLFKEGDASFDEDFDIPSGVTFGGINEVVFAKISGAPSVAGDITVSHERTDQSETLSINSAGALL